MGRYTRPNSGTGRQTIGDGTDASKFKAAACICVLANCETGWRSPLRTADRRLAAMGALGAHSHRHSGIAALVAAVAALCMGLGAGTAFAQSTASFDQGSRAWWCSMLIVSTSPCAPLWLSVRHIGFPAVVGAH